MTSIYLTRINKRDLIFSTLSESLLFHPFANVAFLKTSFVSALFKLHQSAGKLIETGLNTLQKTLLLKREVEVDKVSQELQQKRNEFQKRMELCEKRRVEIQRKQQQVSGMSTW